MTLISVISVRSVCDYLRERISVHVVPDDVLGVEAHHPGGYAQGYGVAGYVVRHHRVGTYHHVVSDGDVGDDFSAGVDYHVVANPLWHPLATCAAYCYALKDGAVVSDDGVAVYYYAGEVREVESSAYLRPEPQLYARQILVVLMYEVHHPVERPPRPSLPLQEGADAEPEGQFKRMAGDEPPADGYPPHNGGRKPL